jgi:hypothetical protein
MKGTFFESPWLPTSCSPSSFFFCAPLLSLALPLLKLAAPSSLFTGELLKPRLRHACRAHSLLQLPFLIVCSLLTCFLFSLCSSHSRRRLRHASSASCMQPNTALCPSNRDLSPCALDSFAPAGNSDSPTAPLHRSILWYTWSTVTNVELLARLFFRPSLFPSPSLSLATSP